MPIPTAIPTRYADTEFRSRLEARWAAFFDLVGWRWEYEPIDLPGWIPDFMLIGDTTVLVEIKPADTIDGFDLNKITGACRRGESDLEVLLLGRAPQLQYGSQLGWTIEEGVDWGDLAVFCWSEPTGLDFAAWTMSYEGRLTGLYDGNPPSGMTLERINLVATLWREAGNITRWKRPGR